MAFKLTPGKDWVNQINKMMEDYSGFSNGWQLTDSTARWGRTTFPKESFVAMNGAKINYIGLQQYVWNGQPVNFFVFGINIPKLATLTSRDFIKLPFKCNVVIGTVQDCVGSTGYVRVQAGNGNDTFGIANDSGVDVQGDVVGTCVIL